MKLSTKLITLLLIFTPVLHSATHKSVDALKSEIQTVDVQAFKESCSTFLLSELTRHERKSALAQLKQYAQENKLQIQDELASMGDATTNKTVITKGIAQIVGGLLLSVGNLFCTRLHYKIDFGHHPSILRYTVLPYLPTLVGAEYIANRTGLNLTIPEVSESSSPPLESAQGNKKSSKNSIWQAAEVLFKGFHKKSTKSTEPTIPKKTKITHNPTLAGHCLFIGHIIGGAYLSYLGFKHGMANFMNGWSYDEYLRQQLENLDEIIAHLQKLEETVS